MTAISTSTAAGEHLLRQRQLARLRSGALHLLLQRRQSLPLGLVSRRLQRLGALLNQRGRRRVQSHLLAGERRLLGLRGPRLQTGVLRGQGLELRLRESQRDFQAKAATPDEGTRTRDLEPFASRTRRNFNLGSLGEI